MPSLLSTPSYMGGAGQPGGQYSGAYSPYSLLSTAPDEMDRAVERSQNVRRPDRGFEGGTAGDFDPSMVNTEQEHSLANVAGMNVSMRDITGAMMPGKMETAATLGLRGLQEAFGPHAVTGTYGSPSLQQVNAPAYQQAVQAARAANMNRGLFSNPNVTPQAQFGNMSAPVHQGFASPASLLDMQPDETFGGVMANVNGDPSASGGDPSRGANAGMGGIGGGVGDVGAGNPGGTGVL